MPNKARETVQTTKPQTVLPLVGERIRLRREEKKMSRMDLAYEVGVSQQSVYGWEGGAVPAFHRLKKLARVLDTTVEWLTLGISVNVPIPTNYTLVPLLGTELQGGGVQYHDEVGELKDDRNSFAYRKDFLERLDVQPEWCRVFMASDDSMNLGEQLLVDTKQTTIEDGRVYIIDSPAGPIARRLFTQLDQKVRVLADRRDIPEQIVPPEAVRVIGRVVAFQGTL
jgi:transcriptional regulator with XRE-family HTH domain